MSDEDDEVITEMDVYLCKGTLPEGSKVRRPPPLRGTGSHLSVDHRRHASCRAFCSLWVV